MQLNVAVELGTMTVPVGTKPATQMQITLRPVGANAAALSFTSVFGPTAHVDVGDLALGDYVIGLQAIDEDGGAVGGQLTLGISIPAGTTQILIPIGMTANVSDNV